MPTHDEPPVPQPILREARADDLPEVVGLISALAAFERLPGPDPAAAGRLRRDLARGRFRLLVVELDGGLVAYALYFFTYSTFLAEPTLYLEDLFVHPRARGQGLGERLMRALATVAADEGCGRFEWTVLDWNEGAQRFYRRLGAEVLADWRICRVTGEALARLAGPAAPSAPG